ncbi:hypothetical protein QMK19_30530 [Streptomyces sp. H10-C2]|uniref:DUF6257 family protein n=1 Tax=unclassified Streptomyces TaxID=2593676 RepID=UPI0024B904D9|nr:MULTISPECIES: hypothetical protein [unclassified Streptomyces]MDJ0345963.1 hypothetical protein [Streptomyces sp. PH10-H1]MDJ0373870.1 hypothetical protein [Streptomyces sp. H10-C2]
MIRTHPNDPPLTARESAEIARMTALAVLRGGTYTTAQERRIDRILDGARKREAAGK